MIPLGLEPKTYCLEGSCSIQLSYGTDLNKFCGCKGRHFFGNTQILDLKSYVCSIIKAVKARCEAFCGLEFADVERVVMTLFVEFGL